MRAHWLIEVDVFADTAQRVCAALRDRGQPWTRYHDEIRSTELPGTDVPLVFWGSLGAAYSQRVAQRWKPGAIGDIDRFRCSAYFRGLKDLPLANADSVFTSVAQLVADPGAVAAALGAPARVFVRPDNALKPFSGRELALSDATLEALDHGYYYEDEQLPILVSLPKHVRAEWRFVIADGTVVAGCEYDPSRAGAGLDVPDGAQRLAGLVATAHWQAAPLYVVDVGEVDGQFRILELNPFSGADLYHCNPGAVVEAASRIAERLFEQPER